MNSIWSKELIDDLTALWNDGQSVDEIGRAMHLTRNQVMGKIHRLRQDGVELKARGEPASLSRQSRGIASSRKEQAKVFDETSSVSSGPLFVRMGRGMGPIRSASNAAPAGTGCLFIALDPITELREGRDPHCGTIRAAGSPYCEEHRAACCVVAQPQARRKAA